MAMEFGVNECSEGTAIGWDDYGDCCDYGDDGDDDGCELSWEDKSDEDESERQDHISRARRMIRAVVNGNLAVAVKKAKILYQETKNARVGDSVKCAGCGRHFVKTTYNKTFCSNGRTVKGKSSCKDRYHNMVASLRNTQS